MGSILQCDALILAAQAPSEFGGFCLPIDYCLLPTIIISLIKTSIICCILERIFNGPWLVHRSSFDEVLFLDIATIFPDADRQAHSIRLQQAISSST